MTPQMMFNLSGRRKGLAYKIRDEDGFAQSVLLMAIAKKKAIAAKRNKRKNGQHITQASTYRILLYLKVPK